MPRAESHRELQVYQRAFKVSSEIYELSKTFSSGGNVFPDRSDPKVISIGQHNLAEAWRKRRYEASFVSKLSDAEAEAAETQVWLEYAVACKYMDRKTAADLYQRLTRSSRRSLE